MSPSASRRGLRAALSYGTLTLLAVLASVPVSAALPPDQRALVLRLVAAALLGVALVDVVRWLRERCEPAGPRRGASRSVHETPEDIDRHLRTLRDELRAGVASQRYFDRVLWPRLTGLAARLPDRPVLAPPPRSLARRLCRRGPSPAALRAVLAQLDARS